MGFLLDKYIFEGPFISTNELKNRKGVFVVIDITGDTIFRLLKAEGATHVQSKTRNYIETTSLANNCNGRVAFGANYTSKLPKPGRKIIVREIQRHYG
ncbi:MAG: hypothetical protein K8R79_00740 [Calditrichales bacterium]|nr:hypothetical protein [Calditrichales bacterium]